ncbi:MAG: SAF domain-containing protein [Acidimicrobiales bacterium]|nr:SAF domain-containing protein [Acidimicrobiales bacterium]
MTKVVTLPGELEIAAGRANADEGACEPTLRRTPRSRATLPSSRALIGALLVTVSAAGTYSAYNGAADGPRGSAVVAATAIDPGQRIDRSAIRVIRVDLPRGSAQNSFSDADAVEGSLALAPLAEGDLIQQSAVLPPAADPRAAPAPQFSFTVERDRALNGTIKRGEHVDLLATYGSGDAAYTMVVARSAFVVSVTDGGNATLGSNAKLALTIELDNPATVVRAAHATQVAAITLIRTTGVATESSPDVYRPDSPLPVRTRQDTTNSAASDP